MHWKDVYGQGAYEKLSELGDKARLENVLWHLRTLAHNVANELRLGNRVITLGGDHTSGAGSLAGAQAAFGADARLGLIWIDAHPDIHTFQSSVSKALHGMPMGTVTGLDDTLALGGEFAIKLKPENVVFAGLRDIDEGEIQNAQSLGINLLTMDNLRAGGIDKTLQEAVAQLASQCDQIILSVDLDAFSNDFTSAVGSPVAGGFAPDEILPILSEIVQKYPVQIIEIVEFNPTLPGVEETFNSLIQVLNVLLRHQ